MDMKIRKPVYILMVWLLSCVRTSSFKEENQGERSCYSNTKMSPEGLKNRINENATSLLLSGWLLSQNENNIHKFSLGGLFLNERVSTTAAFFSKKERAIFLARDDINGRIKLEISPVKTKNGYLLPDKTYDLCIFDHQSVILDNNQYTRFFRNGSFWNFLEIAQEYNLILEGEGIKNLGELKGGYYRNDIIIRPGEIIAKETEIRIKVALYKIIFEEDAIGMLSDANTWFVFKKRAKDNNQIFNIKKVIIEDEANISSEINKIFKSYYRFNEVECRKHQNLNGLKAGVFGCSEIRRINFKEGNKIKTPSLFIQFNGYNCRLISVFDLTKVTKILFHVREGLQIEDNDIECVRIDNPQIEVIFKDYAFLILLKLEQGALNINQLTISIHRQKQWKMLTINFDRTDHILNRHPIKRLRLKNAECLLQVESLDIKKLDYFSGNGTFISEEPEELLIDNSYMKLDVRSMELDLGQLCYLFYLATNHLERLKIYVGPIETLYNARYWNVLNVKPIIIQNRIEIHKLRPEYDESAIRVRLQKRFKDLTYKFCEWTSHGRP